MPSHSTKIARWWSWSKVHLVKAAIVRFSIALCWKQPGTKIWIKIFVSIQVVTVWIYVLGHHHCIKWHWSSGQLIDNPSFIIWTLSTRAQVVHMIMCESVIQFYQKRKSLPRLRHTPGCDSESPSTDWGLKQQKEEIFPFLKLQTNVLGLP